MNNFFLYARKSTDVEDKQVLSIEGQLAELRTLARQQNFLIIDELVEKQSAKVPGRPIFNSMLGRIESGEATGILAWHPDRLARNSVDGGRIIHLLDTNRLTALKFPQFWFESNPQGKFMLNIAFGQSKYYVDSLAENTKRGLRQKVRRGEYPSLAPYGYLNDTRRKSIVIDRVRGPAIAQAFEHYAKNNSTLEDIANFLAQHGMTSRGKKLLHRDRVTYILRNPFYYGHFRYAGEVHEGKHPPLISKKLFNDVQVVLEERSRPHYKSKNSAPPLCGLLTCESCGMSITGERKMKRQQNGNVHHYTYYRCTKKRKDMLCHEPCVREENLDRSLSALLLGVSLRPDWAELMRQMTAQDEAECAQSNAAIVTGARQEIADIDEKLQRLLDGYLEQVIERETYLARKAALLSAKKTLQDKIARLTHSANAWLEPLKEWIKDAETLSKIATGTDLLQKKAAGKKAFGSKLLLAKKEVVVQEDKAPDFSLQDPWAALRAANRQSQENPKCPVVVGVYGIARTDSMKWC